MMITNNTNNNRPGYSGIVSRRRELAPGNTVSVSGRVIRAAATLLTGAVGFAALFAAGANFVQMIPFAAALIAFFALPALISRRENAKIASTPFFDSDYRGNTYMMFDMTLAGLSPIEGYDFLFTPILYYNPEATPDFQATVAQISKYCHKSRMIFCGFSACDGRSGEMEMTLYIYARSAKRKSSLEMFLLSLDCNRFRMAALRDPDWLTFTGHLLPEGEEFAKRQHSLFSDYLAEINHDFMTQVFTEYQLVFSNPDDAADCARNFPEFKCRTSGNTLFIGVATHPGLGFLNATAHDIITLAKRYGGSLRGDIRYSTEIPA